MSWFWYALATPVLYSVTNVLDKFLVEKRIRNPVMITIMSGFLVLVGGIVMGLAGLFKPLEAGQIGILILAGILLKIYILPYYSALKLEDASRVVPLFAFVQVFVLIMGYLFLNESITRDQFLGFLLITASGFVLSARRVDVGLFRPRPSFWYMLLSSFLYACVLVLFRAVVKTEDFWTTLTYEFIGMGLGAILLLVWQMRQSGFRRDWTQAVQSFGVVSVNEGLGLLAQTAEAYALALAPAALVTIVGGTQPLFLLIEGLILSTWFSHILKEDTRMKIVGLKVFAIALIFLGMFLLNE